MREFFVGNLKFKIIAVLLAFLAWSYVHSVSPSDIFNPFGNRERKVTLSVQYLNLRPDLKMSKSTDSVELVIKEGIKTFGNNESLGAYVDLEQIEEPGSYYLEIELDIPQWITLKSQRPKFALTLIEEVTK